MSQSVSDWIEVRMTTIGTRVRDMREAKGWTPAELARAADLPENELLDIEDGTWRFVDHGTLAKIARALGCGVASLAQRRRVSGG